MGFNPRVKGVRKPTPLNDPPTLQKTKQKLANTAFEPKPLIYPTFPTTDRPVKSIDTFPPQSVKSLYQPNNNQMPSQHQKNRNILSLSPFFLTLILITIVAVTSIFGQESLKSNTNEKPRLCEIEADPEIFLGEPHDVSAEYKFGFEMVWLSDVSHGPCTNRSKIEYRFDEDYQNRTAKKTLKQFEKMIKTNRKSQKIRGVYTIIIQRYEKANETDRRFDYQVRIMRILRVGLK